MFDEVIARFFSDQKSFEEGMTLLSKFDTQTSKGSVQIVQFIVSLDEIDESRLNRAIEYRTQRDRSAPPATIPTLDPSIQASLLALTEHFQPLASCNISTLIDKYIAERQRKWHSKNIETNTRDIKPKLMLLVSVLGDIKSNELTKSNIVQFKDALFKIPSNRTKGAFAQHTVAELLDNDTPEDKVLSLTTIKNYAGKVSSFLQWLSRHNYSIRDLEEPLLEMGSADKAAHEERPQFTAEELTRLFESKQYRFGTHKKPSHFWVPLLALFTGARQSELCQLYKEDISYDEGSKVWVININSKKDKKLKKSHHARLIPIHNMLIKLQFLKYVESVESDRIFPDLNRKRDGYGQEFSKWFCRTYLNERHCNIRNQSDSADAVFHSFRHTVITQLINEGNVSTNDVAHLMGHQTPNPTETARRYSKPKEIRKKSEIINKLHYPSIDFAKIRSWK